MPLVFTDAQIRALLVEPKELPRTWRSRLVPRRAREFRHSRARLFLRGVHGTHFCIRVRQNDLNPLDFSVILMCQVPKRNLWFRLRRYNGLHPSRHRNRLEDKWISGFHVHDATQRYQERDMDEDGFAEPTKRFANFQGALDCLERECGIVIVGPSPAQASLFK